jgi:phosphatidylinositol kinase/protein kinase (PI-3  family)
MNDEDYDFDEGGQLVGRWDDKAHDPDEPDELNWRELLKLSDEERLEQMMRRFRKEHRNTGNPEIDSLIKNVEIRNKLMKIVEHIPHLKYKNPAMLVLGYCINENRGKLDVLSQYIAKIDNEEPNKVKASIIRYMRLIAETIKNSSD